ncbi:MAG: MBL fold metallo-hydrolase [Sediminibacterium sp.]|jgi:glyoxylase-like metal-dependent hydrolase (beta-lactamase superfamily II)|nr:MAG: MBL fold metallo-hydrolase [Sediminibacterium sp.]
MKLYSINAGYFKLDGGAMYGVVPKSMWNKLNPSDENNLCNWALRCLLVEDGNRLILIDNGVGNKQDAKFFGHYHLSGTTAIDEALAVHGFHSSDITDVLLTHLHFDHCGGSINRIGDKLLPAFNNAIYWSNQDHWNWATQPNDREKASFLKENILPIQESGQLQFIQIPINDLNTTGKLGTTAFTNNIAIRFVNGHTNQMMLPQLNYNGRTMVYTADLLPSVSHIPLPYVMAYDMFPYTTLQEKKSFLQEAAAGNYVLYFEHDAFNECCDLQLTEKGIRAGNCFTLNDI